MTTTTERTLAAAVQRYARMELCIGELMPPAFPAVCAACDVPCCRPECGREIIASWWLRSVSEHVHGRWWEDPARQEYPCRALEETGCMLRAGRAVICRSYHCEKLPAACDNVWDLIRFACLSELIGWVGRLSSRVMLDALDEPEVIEHLETIHNRLDGADRILDCCRTLADASLPVELRWPAALTVIAENPTLLRPIVCRRLLELLRAETGLSTTPV